MPSRMIRDWTDSSRMEGISAEAERLFMRILMKADDYGRFHADSRLLKAHCFPLEDTIAANHIGPWLIELEKRGLLVTYTVSDRMFLAIPNYGQRLRTSRAKFPPMPGESGDWLPMFTEFPRLADNCPQPAADCGNAPPEVEEKGSRREDEVEGEAEAECRDPQRNPATKMIESIRLAYPRHTHIREACSEIETAIRRNGGNAQAILDGTKAVAAMLKKWPQNELLRYAKTPPNFFAGDHWQDDPSFWASKQTANGKPSTLEKETLFGPEYTQA